MFPQALIILVALLLTLELLLSLSNYSIPDKRQDSRWGHVRAGGKVRIAPRLAEDPPARTCQKEVGTVHLCDTKPVQFAGLTLFKTESLSSGFPSSVCAADYSYLFTYPCWITSYLLDLLL